jgi:hypothetical protein
MSKRGFDDKTPKSSDEMKNSKYRNSHLTKVNTLGFVIVGQPAEESPLES